MKQIKRGEVNPENLITKAEYARKIGVTPPAVDKMVNNGYVTIVVVQGTELIYQE